MVVFEERPVYLGLSSTSLKLRRPTILTFFREQVFMPDIITRPLIGSLICVVQAF